LAFDTAGVPTKPVGKARFDEQKRDLRHKHQHTADASNHAVTNKISDDSGKPRMHTISKTRKHALNPVLKRRGESKDRLEQSEHHDQEDNDAKDSMK
jgi:hypothetical protein